MSQHLTADDIWPLLQKLPHAEQVRLAKMALSAASRGGKADGASYEARPPAPDEFGSDDDPLAWEGDGWDEFDASR